jgi:hypothetical protein
MRPAISVLAVAPPPCQKKCMEADRIPGPDQTAAP